MIGLYGSINDELTNKLKDYTISIYLNNKELYKKEEGYIVLNGIKYIISLNSFFQVNTSNITNLYDLVIKYGKFTKEDNVLDLYCGLGSISLYISKYCKNVLGIEINESSIDDANKNMKINNVSNTKFICSDVSKILDENYHYDIVIVDPPRSGLDSYTKDILKKIKSKRIVYVSCDPMTLVRDVKDLSDVYEFNDISLVDMFPNTYHVESVVVLERK
jgi:23S rRNA (uracil-5-)-methyltransferase RumA